MLRGTAQEQNRKELINLINALSENEIPTVKTFVEFVIQKKRKSAAVKSRKEKTLKEFLANAPEVDEELNEKEKKILEKRSKEAKKELNEGKLIPFEKIKRLYGKI